MSTAMPDLESFVARLKSIEPRLGVSGDELVALFWQAHPRFQFFKTLPWDARVLDIGAGSGGLAHWKNWGRPPRPDLELYGVDLEIGEYSNLYRGWEAIDLDATLPAFAGIELSAFYTSHLIEHLAEPVRLLRWIGERAPPRAKIYLEWPNPNSMQLPKRSELSERGIDVVISNFTDDLTHRETPDLSTCCRWLGEAGFVVLSSGTIDIGMVGEELFIRGRDSGERTMGYWSITGFSHYITAVKL